MKPCSASPRRPPVDKTTARACFISNALVLPGLGSIAAGRRVGYFQTAAALAGFVMTALFTAWLIKSIAGLPRLPVSVDEWGRLLPQWSRWLKIGGLGFALFITAWLWALTTSLSLVSEARRAAPDSGSRP